MSSWIDSGYDVIQELSDEYYFAGPNWNTQVAKRFVLKNLRINKIIEGSYYLHLNDGEPVNVAFEPSTSFGCPVGCLFCASGNLFPIRSLKKEEIISQVDALISVFNEDVKNNSSIRKDVFYAGIGEPTLMPNTLIDASMDLLETYPELRFKMSTMGANPKGLLKWVHSEVPLRSVQVGIPHWDEAKIKYLYNKADKYSLEQVLLSLQELKEIKKDTSIKINYIGIKGFNESEYDLRKTIEHISKYLGNDFELKLSCLNPTEFGKQNEMKSFSQVELEDLLPIARSYDLQKVYVFGPMSDTKLGCGQLAGTYSS